jgi:hypothetical protein
MLFIIPLIICIIIYCTCQNSSPEKILNKHFNVNLSSFDYNIEFMEKTGHPDASVDTRVIFKFNQLTKENIEYIQNHQFKSLPISEAKQLRRFFDKIPKQFTTSHSGYYLYDIHSSCCGLYNKIFIIDTHKNMAILYYQIM